MLILLPPSEGKAAAPAEGPPLDLKALSFPGLARTRREVLAALTALCRGRREVARETLGLSPAQAPEVLANRTLRRTPALPAAELFTGVLYDNLGLATLDEAAGERARERLLIFSALFGALRPHDRIPPYRLAMGVSLPPLGGLAAHWRPALTAALPPGGGLLVDLRSAPYAAAWRPAGAVAVRVVRERLVDGVARRTVVSHMAKATRGVVARALVETAAEPATAAELIKVLHDLGHAAEPTAAGVDIVVND